MQLIGLLLGHAALAQTFLPRATDLLDLKPSTRLPLISGSSASWAVGKSEEHATGDEVCPAWIQAFIAMHKAQRGKPNTKYLVCGHFEPLSCNMLVCKDNLTPSQHCARLCMHVPSPCN